MSECLFAALCLAFGLGALVAASMSILIDGGDDHGRMG